MNQGSGPRETRAASAEASDPNPPGAEEPASVRSARLIQLGTHCVYAAKARIWGSPPWREDLSLPENLDAFLPHLVLFTNVAREQALDGYALEFPGRYGETLAELARTVRQALGQLSDRDPAGERCMDQEIEDPRWCFSFGGEKLFVNAFAPCYDEGNSRFGFGCASTLLLLQPRHSFARAILPGDSVLPNVVRARIRDEYRLQGRGYDTAVSTSPFEAYRVVRPLRPGDPVVRWWES